MKQLSLAVLRLMFATLWLAPNIRCELFINEILFNPPGIDAPNEYIELRGTPNLVLPNGTYFVSIAGDTNRNPGTLKNVFDLSGRTVGGNGFLVLLQKNSPYQVNSNAAVLMNSGSGSGWGTGGGSSIGHRGDNGLTDLENASVTFFLIQTANPPMAGSDIDADNDGLPDGPQFAAWTVLDSIGILGNNGAGDFAYGAINFRRNPNAFAPGTIIPVSFTPTYVGRSGNTTGAAAADWVASNNLGGAPATGYTLGPNGDTQPSSFGGAPLNHVGAPNFGAPAIAGVVVSQSGGSTDVSESGATDSYLVGLNTVPAGNVTLQLSADPQLQISTDGGVTFGNSKVLTFANTTLKPVTVRAVDDNVVETSPHPAFVRQTISATADAAHYPLGSLAVLKVNIIENDSLLLNELKVNPPGPMDNPFEFVEIRGAPGALLTNVYLLAIEGDAENNPGKINLALNLTSNYLGNNGLLVILAPGAPYVIPPGSSVLTDARFDAPGGALGNASISFLLVSSPAGFKEGKDLDAGDNGTLEGLPDGATILDAVGWSDGATNDVIYGGAVLSLSLPTPDAATRFPSNNVPRSASAWFYGELQGSNAASLIYDSSNVSSNFPFGAVLTPGNSNKTAIAVSRPRPLSGVIGDPTNPSLSFEVSSTDTSPDALQASASSSNPSVVPDANLNVSAGTGGQRALALTPLGVGYSTITITVNDGHNLGQVVFPYAASAMGRPGGRFHTGASDASTAIAIDSDLMFVGDDENQTIRLYHRNSSGQPVSLFAFQDFLALTPEDFGEVDIEGSTRVGNRLFWLGSESNNNSAHTRVNRSHTFATDLTGAGEASVLTYAGRYDHLKEDLLNWDASNLHGKGSNYYGFVASTLDGVNPKAPDGFNIEGLTMAPGSSSVAFLGFRAPLVPPSERAAALIVPVTNFDVLVVSGGPVGSAKFGPPIELNLRCRGIRSLEAVAAGVLISAGPPGPNKGIPPHDFRLFTWTGNPGDIPEERAADLSGMDPEGIVEVPPPPWLASTQIQLVSDNGTADFYNDGMEAKHLPFLEFKKFRSDWVALGEVVVSRPACYKFVLSNGAATLSWCSVPNLIYRVQFKSNLETTSWSDLPGDVTAVGPLTSKSFPVASSGQRFYRVRVLP